MPKKSSLWKESSSRSIFLVEMSDFVPVDFGCYIFPTPCKSCGERSTHTWNALFAFLLGTIVYPFLPPLWAARGFPCPFLLHRVLRETHIWLEGIGSLLFLIAFFGLSFLMESMVCDKQLQGWDKREVAIFPSSGPSSCFSLLPFGQIRL